MPLPTEARAPWPPADWQPVAAEIAEASVWYAGDPAKLADFYGRSAVNQQRPSLARFWSRNRAVSTPDPHRLHLPAAADVAAAGADALFGEEVRLTVEADTDAGKADATKATDRLAELADLDGHASTLLEAAEVCAALGSVYLRAGWSTDVPHPTVTVLHADQAVPVFRWGRLAEVTLTREVGRIGAQVWRHLEHHAAGKPIEHGLYVGTDQAIGVRRPLSAHPDTAGLADEVPVPAGVPDGLCVRYVPNARPNRLHRRLPVGRADVAGLWSLLDGLDEAWSSWLRDLRLGKARILVPDEYLDRRGRGQGATFDADAEVFVGLNMPPGIDGPTVTSFQLRVEEHARTCADLFRQIAGSAGYSPSTFGLPDEVTGAVTATEVQAREDRTQRTTARKRRYWRPQVEAIGAALLAIDREHYNRSTPLGRPRLAWPQPAADPQATAVTLDLLNRAQAVSIETRVRMAQPGLSDDQVVEEVRRIRVEAGLMLGDPEVPALGAVEEP